MDEIRKEAMALLEKCQAKNIPAVFIAGKENEILKASIGNEETSAMLIGQFLADNDELQEAFVSEMEKLMGNTEDNEDGE